MIRKIKRHALFTSALMFISISAWGASGSITITSVPVDDIASVTSNFSVQGNYVMTEDDSAPQDNSCSPYSGRTVPYYWDGLYGIGTYAQLIYSVDGVYKGTLGEIYVSAYGPTNLGRLLDFSAYVNIGGLDPNQIHTVNIYFQDVYGLICYVPNTLYDPSWRNGSVFVQSSLQFRIGGPCDLKISTQNQTITSCLAQKISISASITDSSGKPITWDIALPNGVKVEGSGGIASASWDGKIDGGAKAGTYTATITAKSGMCSTTETVTITITSCPEICDDNGDNNGDGQVDEGCWGKGCLNTSN